MIIVAPNAEVFTNTKHSYKRFGLRIVAEKTKAPIKKIGERIKKKNTVENHVKLLKATDSVDEGRKTGRTSVPM